VFFDVHGPWIPKGSTDSVPPHFCPVLTFVAFPFLLQTSQKSFSVSCIKCIDCSGVKVSVDAVVWSIPCCFPKFDVHGPWIPKGSTDSVPPHSCPVLTFVAFPFLLQTSQKSLSVSCTKWIDCCGVKVSVDAVVWSILATFQNPTTGLYQSYGVVRSIAFSPSFLVIPLRQTSETQRFSTADSAGTRSCIRVCIIAVVVRRCFARTTSDFFSNRRFYLFSSRRQTRHNERVFGSSDRSHQC
jgi:hypothetical protein